MPSSIGPTPSPIHFTNQDEAIAGPTETPNNSSNLKRPGGTQEDGPEKKARSGQTLSAEANKGPEELRSDQDESDFCQGLIERGFLRKQARELTEAAKIAPSLIAIINSLGSTTKAKVDWLVSLMRDTQGKEISPKVEEFVAQQLPIIYNKEKIFIDGYKVSLEGRRARNALLAKVFRKNDKKSILVRLATSPQLNDVLFPEGIFEKKQVEKLSVLNDHLRGKEQFLSDYVETNFPQIFESRNNCSSIKLTLSLAQKLLERGGSAPTFNELIQKGDRLNLQSLYSDSINPSQWKKIRELRVTANKQIKLGLNFSTFYNITHHNASGAATQDLVDLSSFLTSHHDLADEFLDLMLSTGRVETLGTSPDLTLVRSLDDPKFRVAVIGLLKLKKADNEYAARLLSNHAIGLQNLHSDTLSEMIELMQEKGNDGYAESFAQSDQEDRGVARLHLEIIRSQITPDLESEGGLAVQKWHRALYTTWIDRGMPLTAETTCVARVPEAIPGDRSARARLLLQRSSSLKMLYNLNKILQKVRNDTAVPSPQRSRGLRVLSKLTEVIQANPGKEWLAHHITFCLPAALLALSPNRVRGLLQESPSVHTVLWAELSKNRPLFNLVRTHLDEFAKLDGETLFHLTRLSQLLTTIGQQVGRDNRITRFVESKLKFIAVTRLDQILQYEPRRRAQSVRHFCDRVVDRANAEARRILGNQHVQARARRFTVHREGVTNPANEAAKVLLDFYSKAPDHLTALDKPTKDQSLTPVQPKLLAESIQQFESRLKKSIVQKSLSYKKLTNSSNLELLDGAGSDRTELPFEAHLETLQDCLDGYREAKSAETLAQEPEKKAQLKNKAEDLKNYTLECGAYLYLNSAHFKSPPKFLEKSKVIKVDLPQILGMFLNLPKIDPSIVEWSETCNTQAQREETIYDLMVDVLFECEVAYAKMSSHKNLQSCWDGGSSRILLRTWPLIGSDPMPNPSDFAEAYSEETKKVLRNISSLPDGEEVTSELRARLERITQLVEDFRASNQEAPSTIFKGLIPEIEPLVKARLSNSYKAMTYPRNVDRVEELMRSNQPHLEYIELPEEFVQTFVDPKKPKAKPSEQHDA